MSDTSQGPGWWQASDGKWYPPEQAPGAPAGPPPGMPPAGPPMGGPPGGAPMGAPAAAGGAGVGDALNYGWKKFQEFVGPILIAVLIYAGVMIVFSLLAAAFAQAFDGVAGQLVLNALQWVVSSIVAIIIIRAVLAIVDGRPIDTGQLFSGDQLGPYIIGSLIFSVIAFVGFLLCIIPGVIFAFLGWYWGYFLLDQKLEPVEAIKASIELVRNNVGTMLGWAVVSILVNFVGLLLCGIGLLVTIPVTYIGTGYLFRRLQGQPVAP